VVLLEAVRRSLSEAIVHGLQAKCQRSVPLAVRVTVERHRHPIRTIPHGLGLDMQLRPALVPVR
jgi:hypothetical protein